MNASPLGTLKMSLLLCAGLSCYSPAAGNDAAYILLYHHVDHDTPRSTSVTPEEFAVHMDYIANNGYRVVRLERMLQALARGRKLKPRSIAITFDDAYPSVLHNALPVLEHRKWPFTVFVSTEAVDRGTTSYLSWEELRQLERRRATIANHSHSHGHLLRREPGESAEGWRARVSGDIEFAQTRLEAELARPAKLFAYPYGEFDAELMDLVADLGYLAVGQQSGPLGPASNPHAAPRFAISSAHAELPRVAEKINTRPFHVVEPAVPATLLEADDDKPTLDLKLTPAPYRDDQLTCFVSDQGTARVRWQNPESTHATVRARNPLPPGRSRYTCTAPHQSIPGIYYWYTHLWLKPRPDGSWPEG